MSRRYLSPLRYPGGKASIAGWLEDVFVSQSGWMDIEIWIEPFAGGAGAALALLQQGSVSEAWLVDANPAIAAFWNAACDEGERLARAVERTAPTMQLWEESRAVLANPAGADTFTLAYAAFIVNRCSRSGIVAPNSGPIGGRSQTGRWNVASRFNATALADRIRYVHRMRSRIRAMHGDGISHIEALNDSGIVDETMLFVDPPYIAEGNRLYDHGMDARTHQRLADVLNHSESRWLLTYDNHEEVRRLYQGRRIMPYSIRNTANRARQATELAILSDNLRADGMPAAA